MYAPSQWETTLHGNDVSHWLGAYLTWSMFLALRPECSLYNKSMAWLLMVKRSVLPVKIQSNNPVNINIIIFLLWQLAIDGARRFFYIDRAMMFSTSSRTSRMSYSNAPRVQEWLLTHWYWEKMVTNLKVTFKNSFLVQAMFYFKSVFN